MSNILICKTRALGDVNRFCTAKSGGPLNFNLFNETTLSVNVV